MELPDAAVADVPIKLEPGGRPRRKKPRHIPPEDTGSAYMCPEQNLDMLDVHGPHPTDWETSSSKAGSLCPPPAF